MAEEVKMSAFIDGFLGFYNERLLQNLGEFFGICLLLSIPIILILVFAIIMKKITLGKWF